MKQCILNHVKKHQKKYLFASGLAFGRGIAKIILVMGGMISISVFAGKSNDNATTTEAQVKIYQALATFNEIEDIAHQRDELIHEHMNEDIKEGIIGHGWEKDTLFHETERVFHQAQNLNEKFRAARQLDELVHEQDVYLKKMGYANIPGEDKFNQIEAIFDQIQ